MASTVKCQFCGKEVSKGFLGMFGGEAKRLSFDAAANHIHCCPACYDKYVAFAAAEDDRFGAKCFSSSTKSREFVTTFLKYYEESQAYKDSTKAKDGYFLYVYPDKRGAVVAIFTTKEVEPGMQVSYRDSEGDHLSSCPGMHRLIQNGVLNKTFDPEDEYDWSDCGMSRLSTGDWMFGPEDISRFDYVLSANGSFTTGFMGTKTVYGQEVMVILNDYKDITYKPSIIEGVIFYRSSLLEYHSKGAALAEQAVSDLKKELGLEAMRSNKTEFYKEARR